MDNSNEFGKYLRQLRNARKLTVRELEKLSGVSHSYVCQIELGQRTASPETIRKLSEALGCTHIGLMIKAGHVTEQEVFGFIDQEKVR